MRAGILGSPRPLPSRTVPVLASGFVVTLALPIFLIAGWRVTGWALGGVLWVGSQGFALLLARLKLGVGNVAASGVVAFGMMFRAIAVMVILIAVAVTDARLALAAALLYALAYTLEFGLSLATYFSGPAR